MPSAAPPPKAIPEPEQAAQQEIVVLASPQERGSIDRTSYIVKDKAEARASNALDLLGRVPSVDVSPSGQVRLIGRGGVTILIDGQEVPNANALLRAMQGSQVARIELVTNPSAQFPARGTGGIINIVTRRSAGAGLGGSVTGSAGSFGAYDLNLSPSWSRGRLALNGGLGLGRSVSRSEQLEEWIVPDSHGDADRVERDESRGESDSRSASMRATVELTARQRLSVFGLATDSHGRTSGEGLIGEGDSLFERRSSARMESAARHIMADFHREGGRQGEQISLSASHVSLELDNRSDHRTAAGPDETSVFRLRSHLSMSDTVLKFGYVRPAGERRLSAGAQYERSGEDSRQLATSAPASGPPAFSQGSIAGAWSEGAAYVTYQFPLIGFDAMGGARLESRGYDIAGVADDPAGGTHLFPSLHLERKLSKWLTANLSYSSRIGWPSIAQLDPRLRFSDPTSAIAGNPRLRPEKSDSVELKLTAIAGGHSADFTAYYQRTRDLRSYSTELDGEVLVSRPVNVGTRRSRGVNLQLRGPLARGLKYVATANLSRETIAGAGIPGLDDGGTGYGGSVQVEYRDGSDGRAGADHVRLSASYSGPSETGLARTSSHARASASWTHALTDRLSAVASVSHWLNSPTSTVFGGDLVSSQKSRSAGPIVKLALTYGLAGASR